MILSVINTHYSTSIELWCLSGMDGWDSSNVPRISSRILATFAFCSLRNPTSIPLIHLSICAEYIKQVGLSKTCKESENQFSRGAEYYKGYCYQWWFSTDSLACKTITLLLGPSKWLQLFMLLNCSRVINTWWGGGMRVTWTQKADNGLNTWGKITWMQLCNLNPDLTWRMAWSHNPALVLGQL